MSLAAAFSVAASIPILRLNRNMWISLIRFRKTTTPIKPCSSSVMKARGWKLKYAPETETYSKDLFAFFTNWPKLTLIAILASEALKSAVKC